MHKPALNAIWLIYMLVFCVVTVMHFLGSMPFELFPSTSKYQTLVYFIIGSLKVKNEKSIFSLCERYDAKVWLSGFIPGGQISVILWESCTCACPRYLL